MEKVTITPVDISVKTRHSEELVERIGRSRNPVAQYIQRFNRTQQAPGALPGSDPDWVPWIFMWNELSVASVLDPTVITAQREMFVDVDIDHGIDYGNTLAWELDHQHPPGTRKAWVQFDLNLDRFYDLYTLDEVPQAMRDMLDRKVSEKWSPSPRNGRPSSQKRPTSVSAEETQ
jgi:purine nucleosidase